MAAQEAAVEAPPPPAISASTAFVFDATAGTPLYALRPDEPHFPASLTKVATALVVLRHAVLDEAVTIEDGDLADLSESQVGLVAGDALTVRDLLIGLLVPSGNDAAKALARHVGAGLPNGAADPRAAFVAEMNALAAELGLANTRFTNPSGVHDPNHVSSARDLALLAAAAMENATFAEIVATPTAYLTSAVDPGQVYRVDTTNQLLLEGMVSGIKTGTTTEAGGCLIAATTIAGNRVIAVVLGSPVYLDEEGAPKSPERFQDARTILATVQSDYRWIDPAAPATVVGLDEELAAWQATLRPGSTVPVPVARAEELRYRLVLGPPGPPNSQVGEVVFFLGSERLAAQPVFQTGGGAPIAGVEANAPAPVDGP